MEISTRGIIYIDKLQKYVNVLVRIGVDVQPGQNLLIWCPVDAAHFARLVTEEAYRAGASNVVVHWEDELTDRIHCLMAPDSHFDKAPEWIKARTQHWVDNKYKMLWVYAPNPRAFHDINPERAQKIQTTMPAIRWTLACVPTPMWARMVFPDASCEKVAEDLLWEAIYTSCRIDEHDSEANWKKHIDNLIGKADTLTAHNFKSLRFSNDLGTDLNVALPKNHLWLSCAEKNTKGRTFVASMPTEEIFTAPLCNSADGIVYATRPLVFEGDIIDNFWLRFKNGKVTEYAANKNQHLLEKLLATYENANRLGEIALASHYSPVSQSGILWYESSFDENASCHLALGYAYPQTVCGAVGKTKDELETMGLNTSPIHVDFMVGSASMNVEGITCSGKAITIFRDGEWNI